MSVHAQPLKFLDDYMVIVGANGCLFTGLVYSIFTNFGFVYPFSHLFKKRQSLRPQERAISVARRLS